MGIWVGMEGKMDGTSWQWKEKKEREEEGT